MLCKLYRDKETGVQHTDAGGGNLQDSSEGRCQGVAGRDYMEIIAVSSICRQTVITTSPAIILSFSISWTTRGYDPTKWE